jgi:hypothetical protein
MAEGAFDALQCFDNVPLETISTFADSDAAL